MGGRDPAQRASHASRQPSLFGALAVGAFPLRLLALLLLAAQAGLLLALTFDARLQGSGATLCRHVTALGVLNKQSNAGVSSCSRAMSAYPAAEPKTPGGATPCAVARAHSHAVQRLSLLCLAPLRLPHPAPAIQLHTDCTSPLFRKQQPTCSSSSRASWRRAWRTICRTTATSSPAVGGREEACMGTGSLATGAQLWQ